MEELTTENKQQIKYMINHGFVRREKTTIPGEYKYILTDKWRQFVSLKNRR